MGATELRHDPAVRPAILALVAGAHWLVLLLMPLPERRNIDRGGAASSELLLISLPYREFERVPPRPKLVPAPVTSPPPRLAPLADETIGAPTSQGTPPPPDSKRSGAQAAMRAVQADDFRALGPNAGREEPHQKAPRSPFAPPPRHKLGDSDEDAVGNPIMWLNENCYVRPKNTRAEPGDPFAAIPMALCSFPLGKLEPRGDLFEHLRKTPPDP